jgi:glycosyltransferase involved in cell wall biosynthesis
VQNKVLEAMAMARAVVLTSGAATGIPAQDGVHFAVADTAAALAARTIELIADPARASAMGGAAQSLVREQAELAMRAGRSSPCDGWADAA